MAISAATPAPDIPRLVDEQLRLYLATKEYSSPSLRHLVNSIRVFTLGGGKRIRPRLCCLGHSAVSGGHPPPAVVRCAAAVELFHTFALIHDDIIDCSDSRRGRPTLHRALAVQPGDDEPGRTDGDGQDGLRKALLAGDLALVWADELFHQSGIADDQRAAAQTIWNALRSQVITGQYLDVDATGRTDCDLTSAMQVVRYKTAKYTVEQPLLLGAALAGGSRSQLSTLSAFGIPLGEAFQLRDDLLGVFGAPEITGKSRLDDLREGKRTPLLAAAMNLCDPAQRSRLFAIIGNPLITENDAAEVREILTVSGAVSAVEAMIDDRRQQTHAILSRPHDLHATTLAELRRLVEEATRRSF
uniref:Polyprenyl synthetase family protein n=1 Tax=Streptomyces sp. WT6 TaxID=1486372 RepID=A0A023PXW3_9ACTN|nr:hypothetical protein wt6.13c [Streptomyces sp. WT6]